MPRIYTQTARITRTEATYKGSEARRAAGMGPQYRVIAKEDATEAGSLVLATQDAAEAEAEAAKWAAYDEVVAVTIITAF